MYRGCQGYCVWKGVGSCWEDEGCGEVVALFGHPPKIGLIMAKGYVACRSGRRGIVVLYLDHSKSWIQLRPIWLFDESPTNTCMIFSLLWYDFLQDIIMNYGFPLKGSSIWDDSCQLICS